MRNIEFFKNANGKQIIVNDLNNGEYTPFTSECRDLVSFLRNSIKNDYPLAYKMCQEKTGYNKDMPNLLNGDFKIVNRFLRCNFSEHDNQPDIDDNGNLILEEVSCPLRGICDDEGIICHPKFSTVLSKREIEVAKEFASGHSIVEICDSLCIAEDTVKNHRSKIYKKLNINKIAELINWAYKNKIVE